MHVFRLADPDEDRSAAGHNVVNGGEAPGKEVAAEAMPGEQTWTDVASSMAAAAQRYLTEDVSVVPQYPSGLCALTCKGSNNYMAYPGSDKEGKVIVYDMTDLMCITEIQARCSPIVALAFSSNGKQLATASQMGTLV